MAEKWYTADNVAPERLFEYLEQARQVKWVYAERAEETVLISKPDFLALAIGPHAWHHGRAFSPGMEIAWWQNRHGLQVRAILSDEQEFPELGIIQWQDTIALEPAPAREHLLLLGQRDSQAVAESPSWRTARVPRLLHYPAEGNWGRVALLVQPYQSSGILSTQRFLELQEGG